MVSYIRRAAEEIRASVDPGIDTSEASAPLFLLYAVLLRVKGGAVTASDVHDAWSAWAEATATESSFVVPFEDLDEPTQKLDEPFVRAIHRAASRLGGS